MSRPTWDIALAALREHLGERAVTHSEAVADTAGRLAQTYGVDEGDARLAGLLHDWSREETAETLLELAGERGIPVGPVDQSVPYLLHAPVGARALADRFPGIPEEVVGAVACHTVGSPVMSDLDMVVYLADMIEPSRRSEGVDSLRVAVGAVSLFELYARAYAQSITHLVAAGKHIHPSTVESWNAIVDRLRSTETAS
ncbi:MAG: bis(5'-nucleosyl)-tetraphosphatase (symmetrical) YqeK [Coriobacteriia bacterium]|nr:bis(5'-nucleosyl)-tetraphosphatase (symmetrical) YqeK [Coriobacteriia bacterium]